MPVLYRKYRPQRFADVVGQEHVTQTLTAALAAGRVAHAYLFSGPRGVGKTTTARLIAKAVNCLSSRHSEESGDEESRTTSEQHPPIPCNACVRCEEITAGRCVDVLEVDAASHTGVDHVREHIIDAARIAPAVAAWKVFIIDEVHMLSTSAFNALLKTLEEPPANVLFVLATTELHDVPETIRSRCQHFAFRRVESETLRVRLAVLAAAEGVHVGDDVLAQVVRAADGGVRDAESTLGQLIALGGTEVTREVAALVLPRSNAARVAELLGALAAGSVAEAIAALDAAEQEGCDADAFCRDIVAELRALVRASAKQGSIAPAQVTALRMFTEVLDRIGRSDHPFFLIEVAVLTLLARAPSVAAPAPRDVPQRQRGADDDAPPPAATSDTPPAPPKASRVKASAPTPPHHAVGNGNDPPPLLEGEREGVRRDIAETHAISPPAERRERKEVGPSTESATEALSKVQQGWQRIIRELSEVNRAIPFLLEGGRPQRIEGTTLIIGFRYKLHADKVRQPSIIDPLTAALARSVGFAVRVETCVIALDEFESLDRACRPATGDTTADAALEVFGGRVLDSAPEGMRAL